MLILIIYKIMMNIINISQKTLLLKPLNPYIIHTKNLILQTIMLLRIQVLIRTY
jgi:hypothetical protein